MRRHFLHLVLTALTFAFGVAAVAVWNSADDISISAPEIPAYRFPVAPASRATTCGVHGAPLHLECIPFNDFTQTQTLSRFYAETYLFPNSRPRRLASGWCETKEIKGLITPVCPRCRAAEVRRDRGEAGP